MQMNSRTDEHITPTHAPASRHRCLREIGTDTALHVLHIYICVCVCARSYLCVCVYDVWVENMCGRDVPYVHMRIYIYKYTCMPNIYNI
jgi:hypothetical protein